MTETKDEPRDAQPARAPEEGGRRAPRRSASPGAAAPFSFAGPLKYKGRWLSGQPHGAHVGALRALLRPVARQHVGEGVGREERRPGHDRAHQQRPARHARGRGGRGAAGTRPVLQPPPDGLVRGPGDQPRVDRPGGREEGRQVHADRAGVDLQPEDEEVLRRLRQLRARPRRLAARPLERRRRVAGDVGPRQARRRRS